MPLENSKQIRVVALATRSRYYDISVDCMYMKLAVTVAYSILILYLLYHRRLKFYQTSVVIYDIVML
jgi:hypothetical protein